MTNDTVNGFARDRFAVGQFTPDPRPSAPARMITASAGGSFRGRSPHEQSEFLASADNWFRPVQVRTGPDGAFEIEKAPEGSWWLTAELYVMWSWELEPDVRVEIVKAMGHASDLKNAPLALERIVHEEPGDENREVRSAATQVVLERYSRLGKGFSRRLFDTGPNRGQPPKAGAKRLSPARLARHVAIAPGTQ